MTLPVGTLIPVVFEDPPPSTWHRAGDERCYTFDFKQFLRSFWQAGHQYAGSSYVRSPTVPGLAFQAGSGGGESGAFEPAWPTAVSGTVTDGSITWTAVAAGSNGTDPISSVSWSILNPPDSALSVNSSSNGIEDATVQLLGGTAQLVYLIQCQITTTAGDKLAAHFNLEVN